MATVKSKETQKQSAGSNGNGSKAPREIIVEDAITVRQLADRMHRSPIDLIKVLMQFGIMAPIDQVLDHDTAAIVGDELGINVLWPKKEASARVGEGEDEDEAAEPEETRTEAQLFVDRVIAQEKPENLKDRPPVVAVLGHVDHGKTTLLDRIRKTNVVDSEAGGITQHTGAYQVTINNKRISFLDTPGHEAFTSMRARGAQVTDIVVLVVAADDGVMPQTKEAINHAKAAGVPIVVAINKVDRPNANLMRVMEELAQQDLNPEEWGGDTITVPLSALKGEGIEDLLENLLVVAELEQFQANPNGRCVGTVIEAELDKYRGVTATVLVQNGTLSQGDAMVVGSTWGRIKAMFDHEGNPIKKAGPSTPVVILGLQEAPEAGEIFEIVSKDKEARRMAEERQLEAERNQEAANVRPQMSLEDLFARMEEGKVETLNIIIRADVQGTLEPVVHSLEGLGNSEVKVKILQSAIGDINESDVMLAEASDAVIIGFNVSIDKSAAVRAENSGVEIRNYDIIYKMIEDIELALTGMLEPIFEERVAGRAEVRQLFRVRRGGLIAGCMVLEGVIKRNAGARLIRRGEVVEKSTVATLKRFTEDVGEVRTGYECGINLAGVNENMEEGDIIEVFEMIQVR
jgi:translation initiation factor IF-2